MPLNTSLDQLSTALVYDRVNTSYGGAEQVVTALEQIFPQADLFTSVYDPNQAKWAESFQVKPSFLQSFPGAKKHHRFYLPLMPLAFEQLDLSGYELIISITSAEAKGVITKPDQLHLCYLLTPSRYLYSHRDQYLQSRPCLNLPGIKWAANKFLDYLTWWDQAAIHRPDKIIPISNLVKLRCAQYYQLETEDPIYPPIDAALQPDNIMPFELLKKHLSLPDHFVLTVSRLVSYKRIDLAIKACTQLGLNLVVVGTGPEQHKLKKLVRKMHPNSQIKLIGSQPQPIVNRLLKQAQAFILPGVDDFGLGPIQANFFGTPAVINHHSGAAEVILERKHGFHVKQNDAKSVKNALKAVLEVDWNRAKLQANARQYSTENFQKSFTNKTQMIL